VAEKAGAIASVYALTAGAITLVGWAAGIRLLTDWLSVGISMFPNTAVCAVQAGSR
jgi:hypothetical protein